MEYVITAVVVLAGNLLSGRCGSRHYENVTAAFGWTAVIAGFLWISFNFASLFSSAVKTIAETLFPIWLFCIASALIRDWEKILKPSFDRFIDK